MNQLALLPLLLLLCGSSAAAPLRLHRPLFPPNGTDAIRYTDARFLKLFFLPPAAFTDLSLTTPEGTAQFQAALQEYITAAVPGAQPTRAVPFPTDSNGVGAIVEFGNYTQSNMLQDVVEVGVFAFMFNGQRLRTALTPPGCGAPCAAGFQTSYSSSTSTVAARVKGLPFPSSATAGPLPAYAKLTSSIRHSALAAGAGDGVLVTVAPHTSGDGLSVVFFGSTGQLADALQSGLGFTFEGQVFQLVVPATAAVPGRRAPPKPRHGAEPKLSGTPSASSDADWFYEFYFNASYADLNLASAAVDAQFSAAIRTAVNAIEPDGGVADIWLSPMDDNVIVVSLLASSLLGGFDSALRAGKFSFTIVASTYVGMAAPPGCGPQCNSYSDLTSRQQRGKVSGLAMPASPEQYAATVASLREALLSFSEVDHTILAPSEDGNVDVWTAMSSFPYDAQKYGLSVGFLVGGSPVYVDFPAQPS